MTVDVTERPDMEVVRFTRRSGDAAIDLSCGVNRSRLRIEDELSVNGRCHGPGGTAAFVVVVSGRFPDIEIRRPGTLDRVPMRLEEVGRQ